jgi:hypothetical protein
MVLKNFLCVLFVNFRNKYTVKLRRFEDVGRKMPFAKTCKKIHTDAHQDPLDSILYKRTLDYICSKDFGDHLDIH